MGLPRGYKFKPETREELLQRFESKINKNGPGGCWLWTGCKNRYGMFRYNKKGQHASRVSYQIYVGEIPEGLYVCHKCDNGICVSPEHLFLGTQKDNIQDCKKKGRLFDVSGENNARAILTEQDLEAIVAFRQYGFGGKRIARMLKLPVGAVESAVTGRNWKKYSDRMKVRIGEDKYKHIEIEYSSRMPD